MRASSREEGEWSADGGTATPHLQALWSEGSCSGVLEPALRARVRPSSWSVTSGGSLKSVAVGMLTLVESAKLYFGLPLPPNPDGLIYPHTPGGRGLWGTRVWLGQEGER